MTPQYRRLAATLCLALGLALTPTLLRAGAEGDAKHETPSASHMVPIKLGSVDAVTGNLSLQFPMGAKVPGRLPIGFTWSYESQDALQGGKASQGTQTIDGLGGVFRPVVWPTFRDGITQGSVSNGDSPLRLTVLVNGQSWVFYPQARPSASAPMPTEAQLRTILASGYGASLMPPAPTSAPAGYTFDDPGTTFVAPPVASSDGTKFFVTVGWNATVEKFNPSTGTSTVYTMPLNTRRIVLDGANAIYTSDGWTTDFVNRWGDHVQVRETHGGTMSPATSNPVQKIEIQDMVTGYTGNKITLTVTETGAPLVTQRTIHYPSGWPLDYSVDQAYWVPVTFTVASTVGGADIPTATGQGYVKGAQRFAPTVPESCPGYDSNAVSLPEGVWDWGIYPTSVVMQASDSSTRTTSMTWNMGVPDPQGRSWPSGYPLSVSLPNGLSESFAYEAVTPLSQYSFSRCTGYWQGFQMTNGYSDLSSQWEYIQPTDMGVSRITFQDGGAGQAVVISRAQPVFTATPTPPNHTTVTCTSPAHTTTILHYATATPGTSEPFRATRLTHPSYTSFTDNLGAQAYLFSSSAITFAETMTGTGAPSDTSKPAGWQPSNPSIYQVVQLDGFDLTSWANPTATLGYGLPVNAVALQTRVYSQNLPTKTTVSGNPNESGARDSWGPIVTHEYTEAPAVFPTVSGTATIVQGSGLPASLTKTVHRTGQIHRFWDWSLFQLITDTDQKSLAIASGSNLRFKAPNVGAAPTNEATAVGFGSTNLSQFNQGLAGNVAGDRHLEPDGFVANEARTYMTGLPLLKDTTKTLTSGVQASYQGSGSVGSTYTYADSHIQVSPSTVLDKLDGRTESFLYDGMGRETSRTDRLGITTTTAYDGWGQVKEVKRLAKGAAGASTTTTTYDPTGLTKTEQTVVAGATLTTTTNYDLWGRITSVTRPDGAVQTSTYDGWGQKATQSPWLLPTQTPYGPATWTYNAKGMVTASFDAKGRRLSSAYDPAAPATIYEPSWGSVSGVTGVITKTWDDRGYLRQEVHDLLGQKIAVIDQKGQLSQFWYDKDGHLLQTQQGSGTKQYRSYTYNDMGWLTSRTEPEEGQTLYSTFTILGTPLVTTQKGRSGTRTTTFTTTADSHLMPSQIVASGPEGSVTRTLTYDYGTANTHLLTGLSETQTMVGPPSLTQALTEAYAYDDLYRLKSKTVSDGTQSFTVSRTFDDAGNELSLTYPSTGDKAAQTQTNTYDSLLRPKTVSFGGSQRGSMDYAAVNGANVKDTLTYGASANGVTTVSTTNQGELVDVLHTWSGGSQDNALTWTAGGLMLSRGTDSFQYDELQRLSYAWTYGVQGEDTKQWFLYDEFGNRKQADYVFNGGANSIAKPDELMAWRTSYSSNDLPGSVSGLTPGSAQGSYTAGTVTGSLSTGTTGSTDDLGRLTQVWAVPGNSVYLTQWVYDPSGRVMKETVNGVATTFLLDAEGLRFKRIAADGTPTYTVYGFHREPLAQYVCPLGKVRTGSKAIQIFHKTGTNSSLSRGLGTFTAGDTITATVWVNAVVGATAQVFMGNVSTSPYTDPQTKKPAGTGTWQQVTITQVVSVTGPFRLYIYGQTNTTAPDLTSTNYDDVLVTSTQRGTVLSEGFESGLSLTTDPNSTTAWYTSGEPTDVDVSGQPGMAEWQKSMVYGFGQLLSEDQLINGTIYVQSDQVGSPNITTNSSGAAISRSKNLPFGERFGSTGTIKSIRRFTNHEDGAGSAIYMQARTYLPAYAKFAQVDPAYDQTKDDPESWNLYNYVTNNPVTHTDPDGRISIDEGMVAANVRYMKTHNVDWNDQMGFGPGTPANFALGPVYALALPGWQYSLVDENANGGKGAVVYTSNHPFSASQIQNQLPSAQTTTQSFTFQATAAIHEDWVTASGVTKDALGGPVIATYAGDGANRSFDTSNGIDNGSARINLVFNVNLTLTNGSLTGISTSIQRQFVSDSHELTPEIRTGANQLNLSVTSGLNGSRGGTVSFSASACNSLAPGSSLAPIRIGGELHFSSTGEYNGMKGSTSGYPWIQLRSFEGGRVIDNVMLSPAIRAPVISLPRTTDYQSGYWR